MKLFANIILMMFCTVSGLQVKAETISRLKAAELACHRVDRLVVLKKVDKAYISKFQKLELVELASNDPSGGKFAVSVYQTAPAAGTAPSLTMLINDAGKVLPELKIENGATGPDIVWPAKDPVSLVEAGLHHVLDEQATNVQLRPFTSDFQSLVLTQKGSGNSTVAEILIKSSTTTAKLVLTVDLNGKFINKQVIP